MSDYENEQRFRRAQLKYDNMMPPEDPPQVECETCGGDGRVDEADEDGKNLRPLCPDCEGKGEVDAPEHDPDPPDEDDRPDDLHDDYEGP
jgi:DnaJ-class molecular chaperone